MTAQGHIGHILTHLILLCLLITSCSREGEIACYEDITDPEGWYEKDTIYLRPDSVSAAGLYQCYINIRTTAAYPYRNFSVIAQVQGTKNRRILHYDITSNGATYHEQQATMGQIALQQGDSVVVAVKQNMRRETMPGIAAVGLKLVKIREK